MNGRIRQAAIVGALVSGLVAAAGAAAAGRVTAGPGTDIDGLYVRFWGSQDAVRAIVVVNDTAAGARIRWAIAGLLSSAEYFIVGTDDDGPCDAQSTAGSRTFRTSFTSSPGGRSFGVWGMNDGGWETTRFLRLVKAGAGTLVCGFSINFTKVEFAAAAGPAGPDADAAITHYGTRGFTLVERLSATTSRATIALTGLEHGHDYTVAGGGAPCGEPNAPEERYFGVVLEDVLVSSFVSRKVELRGEEWRDLESVRVNGRQDLDRYLWDCRRPLIIVVV